MFQRIKAFFEDIGEIRTTLYIISAQNEKDIRHTILPQKECSECFNLIDERARRCPYCTTVLIA